MKKQIAVIALFFAIVSLSCKDTLEEKFLNPEKYEADAISKARGLFTRTLYQSKLYIQDYGEWWYGLGGWNLSNYAQVAIRIPVDNYGPIYQSWKEISSGNGFSSEGDIMTYFNDMYLRMNAWPILKEMIEKPTNQVNKDNNTVYYRLVTVMKNYALIRNVDFFNSIPYFNAMQGINGKLFAEYDDPKEIYKSIIEEWASISRSLKADYDKMTSDEKSKFATQDLAFKGDIAIWIQYINALRLKYAVRISGVDENFAKEQIANAIADGLPTADMTWETPFDPAPTLPGGGTINRSWYERFTSLFIPDIIIQRMNHGTTEYEPGTDDPRLPVIAAPTRYKGANGNPVYIGCSMKAETNQIAWDAVELKDEDGKLLGARPPKTDDDWQYVFINRYDKGSHSNLDPFKWNCVSMYNPATYTFNNIPAYMMSLGEVDLLLAEVALKGLASTGKTAQIHIEESVKHSTDFWYNYKSSTAVDVSKYPLFAPAKPSAAIIDQYAQVIGSNFATAAGIEDKMEIIMQQKYIHLNLIGSHELWTELRRTRHPKLEPLVWPSYYPEPVKAQIERIRYPQSEQISNSDNYQKVVSQDNYTTPLFWVPADKQAESYYGTIIRLK